MGREAEIASVRRDLKAHRLVTIVGTGGIGKTTVALVTPEGNEDDYPDGICLIDLGFVHDAGQVSLAVATALRQTVVSGDPLDPVLQYLRNRKVLLILDSCEHVIEAAANLAERFVVDMDSYFRFITEPDIDPTNNVAEQAIRFVAIHRRLTQGTRGETGQRWCERIWTVISTGAQQGR